MSKISDYFRDKINTINAATKRAGLGDMIRDLQSDFTSAEQTGTGAAQAIPHGLGVVPSRILVVPSNIPSGGGALTYTADAINVTVTATTGTKYYVYARV